jgi:16S rRNA (adenine1518-N6/adenine1519-N6)-dimethyltransferase
MPVVQPINIQNLLRKHGLRAEKSLGQNFLSDEEVLASIVRAAGVGSDDTILEIGPGLGSLTRHLAVASRSVTAIELDRKLISLLEDVLAPYKNIRLIQGDILEQSPADLISAEHYLVVANIPYYITSPILRHLLESQPRPKRIALTVQKEVAERICAPAGDLSLLALSVQVYGKPSMALRIPASAFHPVPKVDSAVLRVDVFDHPLIPDDQRDQFFRITKAGFGQKRKTLRNALSAGLGISAPEADAWLRRSAVDPMRRAETLSIAEWQVLLNECGNGLLRKNG